MKPICVVLTGAGISAESGLATFRAENGLWAGYNIEEVCTPEALRKDRQKVLDFYNMRRRDAAKAQPNAAHLALVELEKRYQVNIITQNVDDLHERAGSSSILHLHGELNKARSTFDPDYIIPCTQDQQISDRDPNGHPMRPHIVFFGESVPMIDKAAQLVAQADIVLIIGTSLQVYPANGLIHHAKQEAQVYLIDPNPNTDFIQRSITTVAKNATLGVVEVVKKLLQAV